MKRAEYKNKSKKLTTAEPERNAPDKKDGVTASLLIPASDRGFSSHKLTARPSPIELTRPRGLCGLHLWHESQLCLMSTAGGNDIRPKHP